MISEVKQKKKVKDPPVKLFEVNQEVGLTSATVSLTFRQAFHLYVK